MNISRILRLPFLLGLTASLCLAAGCKDRQASSPGAPTSPASSAANSDATQADARLQAALAISDTVKRDAALRAVADLAAQVGDAPTVRKAVLQIGNTVNKDAAADTSAMALAKAGKRAEAAEIARMMSNTTKRDDTLLKLAEK